MGPSRAENAPFGFAVAVVAATPVDPAPLVEIISNLDEAAPLAIVVAPYFDGASSADHLALDRSRWPVVEARPGVQVERGHVYVVRHGHPVALKSDRFASARARHGNGAATPLSVLSSSLAEHVGPNAIAVLLSGPDGSENEIEALRTIKRGGGCAIVQDPVSATYDGSPRAALAAGLVDLVLPPAAIAHELLRIARRPNDLSRETDGAADFDGLDGDPAIRDEGFRRVLSLLKNRFGIDLSHYKLTTIHRRVERRMTMSRFDQMSAYADHLRAHSEALQALHDDIFIHVTQFFRDAESFRALKETVFPALIKDRAQDDPIRVWVPGCSTGEEAYSIAIALTEFLEEQESALRLQIFATDISDAAIAHARRATYSDSLLKAIGDQRTNRFFERTKSGYKLRKEIRDLCIISRHDVTTNPPFAKMDLISCRNVLIYFGPGLQKRIVPIFHYALKPSGFLWLGHSETPGGSSRLFSLIDKPNKIYSKLPAPPGLQLASSRFTTEKSEFPRTFTSSARTELDYQRSADQMVLFKYGPPGVVVNYELDILQFRGRTAPLLEPPTGQPTHSLVKMAHPQLLPVLRPLLQAAKKQNITIRKERVTLEYGETRATLNLEVAPLNPLAAERERQYLILFEDAAGRSRTGSSPEVKRHNGRARSGGSSGRRVRTENLTEQLQQEINALREYQQTLIEQFESAQEELTSANEELQATNEEFQSTNEELETAKEELQSTNEELTTMNAELESRNAELVSLNDKLARGEDRFRLMVEGVKDYAIYMLDPEGYVSSWNEGARRLKGYEASEIIGQNYARFFSPEEVEARVPELELDRARIEGRHEAEGWRIRKDGTHFWADVVVTRINDHSGKLIGFSKVTRDLTERKRAQEELESSEQRFKLMTSKVRDYAIFMLDPEGRVTSWNEGAKRLKGYEEAEIRGKHFSVFYPAEDKASGKIEREMEALLRDGRFEDEGWRVRKDGSRFWANVVITRLDDPSGRILGFTKVTRDLSERKRAEEALRSANENLEQRVQDRTRELEQALKTRDEFLSIASHELKTPLTTLKLQLQVARRRLDPERARSLPPEQAASAFDKALKQTVTLEELVDDLLDVSRIQSGRLHLEQEQVDLSQLVRDIAARFVDEAAGKEVAIDLQLEAGLLGRWDPRRLGQVLMNLISNAIKYAPKSDIIISTRRHASHAQMVVADSGPGISAEKQTAIFERFERAGASPNVGGLGLGLFIVRRIVEAHQGTVRIESESGKGSRFIVDLPLEPTLRDQAMALGETSH